jgi:hypothetical protein
MKIISCIAIQVILRFMHYSCFNGIAMYIIHLLQDKGRAIQFHDQINLLRKYYVQHLSFDDIVKRGAMAPADRLASR